MEEFTIRFLITGPQPRLKLTDLMMRCELRRS